MIVIKILTGSIVLGLSLSEGRGLAFSATGLLATFLTPGAQGRAGAFPQLDILMLGLYNCQKMALLG